MSSSPRTAARADFVVLLASAPTGMDRFGARPIDLLPKYDFYRILLDRNNSTVWI